MNYYTVCPDCGYKLLKAGDGSTIEIHCPICGYKLCKGDSGSDVDILCPRCGKLVRVVITETNTNCTPTDAPKKAAKELK